MEAMIFAAGRGTRLAPLTDRQPKALVEVGGVALLERVATKLVDAGVERIVVNVCPFADEIERFVRDRGGFGVDVAISRESPDPLDTGGGLLHAKRLFQGDGPILLHNVDVLTDLDLHALVRAHARSGALATLAMADRASERGLVFDERGLLGRDDDRRGLVVRCRATAGPTRRLSFSGVHVVSRALLDRISETGAFSILEAYLRLSREGERIEPHRVDGCSWIDVGRPEDLARARCPA